MTAAVFSELSYQLKGSFLLRLPSFENGLSEGLFSKELMILLSLFLIMIFSLLLCFVGRRALSTLLFLISGMAGGYVGILFTSRLTSNKLMQLYFFVIFIFAGFAAIYAVSMIINHVISLLSLLSASDIFLVFISAFLGAFFGSTTLYFCIYDSKLLAAVFFFLLFIPGLICQLRAGKSSRIFYTYNDLCSLKPLEEIKGSEDGSGA